MSTSPVKSLIDEQLEDITAHNLRDAYTWPSAEVSSGRQLNSMRRLVTAIGYGKCCAIAWLSWSSGNERCRRAQARPAVGDPLRKTPSRWPVPFRGGPGKRHQEGAGQPQDHPARAASVPGRDAIALLCWRSSFPALALCTTAMLIIALTVHLAQ